MISDQHYAVVIEARIYGLRQLEIQLAYQRSLLEDLYEDLILGDTT